MPVSVTRPHVSRHGLFSWVFVAILSSFSVFTAGAGEPLIDQNGRAHELGPRSYEGVTVLDFAASWCDPCWKVLPKLQKLARAMPKVRFIVISEDEKPEGRDELARGLKLELPVVWDSGHKLAERLGPKGMPATFVLDSKGKVIYRHTGASDKKWTEFVEFLRAAI